MYSPIETRHPGMDRRDTPEPLDVAATPDAVMGREDERETLQRALTSPPRSHLYLTGPRGAGKTLLARTALAACPGTVSTCYLCCRRFDTQYKVLQQLAHHLTGETITDGYHTAQLQALVSRHLAEQETVLVLDELDFLLEADGSDLLYFLSRLDETASFCLVGISASDAPLAARVDERTYSSLQPWHLHLDPYTETDATTILTERFQELFPETPLTRPAVRHIAATSTNILLGLHWLAESAALDTSVTVDVVQAVQPDAVRRYRRARICDLTLHHDLLVAAIEALTTDQPTVTTGAVYEQYAELCRERDDAPLTTRRIGDFLTHLELLDLLDVTHHAGGTTGKTREMQLVPLQEL